MKISRVIMLFWLPLTLAFLSAGCATQRPLVNTWRDPQFSPTPADKIALTDRPNPSAQDAAMDRLLVTELRRAGFALTSSGRADYLITYFLDEAHEERKLVNGSYFDPMSHGPPSHRRTHRALQCHISQSRRRRSA